MTRGVHVVGNKPEIMLCVLMHYSANNKDLRTVFTSSPRTQSEVEFVVLYFLMTCWSEFRVSSSICSFHAQTGKYM